MSISKTLKIFVITLAVASIPAVVFAVPQLPHLFYGNIIINGSPAPTGTVVIAKVGGVEKGRITTATTGIYGGPGAYDQKLLVQGDVSDGAQIDFTVSGVNGTPIALFESSKVEQLNLSFTIVTPTPTPTPTPTQNNNSGGSNSNSTPTPTPTPLSTAANKVDANKDGKIDVLDFNSLMVNWGSTNPNNIADFDGNGKVDVFDFNLLMINWS